MRRRERFVITAIFLGILLWVIQMVPLNWRYLAIVFFSLITYLTSALAFGRDVRARHWLTFLPLPALYSLSIGAFYFLLPTHFTSMITVLGLFSLGMYALFLTGNIFFVVQHHRSIQLLHAAQNIALFFTIIISLLGVQVIFSFNLPYYLNFAAVFALHFPLIYTITWSVNLQKKLSRKLFQLSFFSTLLISEIALVLSFLPLAPWHIALLIMSVFYLILGLLQVFLSEKLFRQAINEYRFLAFFIALMFILLFPGK